MIMRIMTSSFPPAQVFKVADKYHLLNTRPGVSRKLSVRDTIGICNSAAQH